MKNNENKNLCSECGGRCCKKMAGIIFPQQLKEITVNNLSKMIQDGYCFDYWEGNPTTDDENEEKTAYFLRAKHKGYEFDVVDPSWGGECVFLTEIGCKLDFYNRPFMCQALIPKEDYKCKISEEYTKQTASVAWLPFNEIIKEVIDNQNQNL